MKKRLTQALGALLTMATMGLSDVYADNAVGLFTAHTLDWRVINDNVMGGRSLGNISRTDQFLSFHGALNTNGGGFASIRVAAENMLPSSANGVRIRIRGDGRRLLGHLVRAGDRPRDGRADCGWRGVDD